MESVFHTTDSVAARAAELKVLMSGGFGPVMQDLGPKFERVTGHQLIFAIATLGALVKRVQDGETFDVVLGPRSAIDGFLNDGKVATGNVIALASSGMGVAVREGVPHPDISSPEALKRTLLAAKSITYPDSENPVGNPALGLHVAKVIDRLGITDEMKSKTVFSRAVDIGDMVANGEVEIGVTQLQNLVRFAGIEIVGPLPRDLQHTVVFAAAIMASARDARASKALVDFLRTPQAAAVLRTQRMEPVASCW